MNKKTSKYEASMNSFKFSFTMRNIWTHIHSMLVKYQYLSKTRFKGAINEGNNMFPTMLLLKEIIRSLHGSPSFLKNSREHLHSFKNNPYEKRK